MADTASKILDSAEDLFARQGIASTSLRAVIAEAGVNLAAVNYHFGSKENLIKAVLARRIDELNRLRLERLDRARLESEGKLSVHQVLKALIEPVFEMQRRQDGTGKNLLRLMARAHNETDQAIQKEIFSRFGEMAQIFARELVRIIPYLSEEEVATRLAFTVGVMVFTLLSPEHAPPLDAVKMGPDSESLILKRMLTYCSAGFVADSTETAVGDE